MADLYHLLDDLQEETQGTVNDDTTTTTTQDEQELNQDESVDVETRNTDDTDLRQHQRSSLSSSITRTSNVPPALQLEEKKRRQNRQSMVTERTADESVSFDKLTMDSTDMISLSGYMDDNNDEKYNNNDYYDDQDKNDSNNILVVKEKMLAKTQYTQLRQYWINEMNSPELQPYDTELIQSMMEQLIEQDELMEQYNNNGTNQGNENNESAVVVTTGNKNLDALFGSMLRIDTERVKFILCDLLQQRLHKIECHPLYMRNEIQYMSPQEVREEMEY